MTNSEKWNIKSNDEKNRFIDEKVFGWIIDETVKGLRYTKDGKHYKDSANIGDYLNWDGFGFIVELIGLTCLYPGWRSGLVSIISYCPICKEDQPWDVAVLAYCDMKGIEL